MARRPGGQKANGLQGAMATRPGGQCPEGQETHGQEANGQKAKRPMAGGQWPEGPWPGGHTHRHSLSFSFFLFWRSWKSTVAMQLFWFASNHLNLPSHSSSEYSYPKHAISIIRDGSHASTAPRRANCGRVNSTCCPATRGRSYVYQGLSSPAEEICQLQVLPGQEVYSTGEGSQNFTSRGWL